MNSVWEAFLEGINYQFRIALLLVLLGKKSNEKMAKLLS